MGPLGAARHVTIVVAVQDVAVTATSRKIGCLGPAADRVVRGLGVETIEELAHLPLPTPQVRTQHGDLVAVGHLDRAHRLDPTADAEAERVGGGTLRTHCVSPRGDTR